VIRRWRVRLRYRDGRSIPTHDRLPTADWLAVVLPKEADVNPVVVLPVSGGWVVSMPVRAITGAHVMDQAMGLVEAVVGDAERVLGRLVSSQILP